jgi:hypothetical protein
MNGARLLQQADLAGARGDRNTASASWRTANFVVGLNVRRGSERALGMGACAISWRDYVETNIRTHRDATGCPDLLTTTGEKPRAAELRKSRRFQKAPLEAGGGSA